MFFLKIDLNEKIANWKSCKENFGLNIVIEYLIQIADAINFLHTKNPRVIHRDIKPKNIFIKPNGTIKIGDFGVSTFVRNIPNDSDEMLSEQTYVGTYFYRLKVMKYHKNIGIIKIIK